MIELKNVSTGYGKRPVIQNLSFRAGSGEITVLLGKNGQGKTTLLRAISGSLPYTGSISLDGREVRAMKPQLRARSLGAMPQILRSPDITVRELVSYGRQPYTGLTGILQEKDHDMVSRAISQVGIEALSESYVNQISGGERQKAYFALLLAQDTPNLLLDEPGAFLDADAMGRLCNFLRQAKAKGKTVLAVMHDINRALYLADQVVALCGDKPFIGTPEQVMENRIPQRFFGLEGFRCQSENGKTITFFQ